MKLFRLLNLGVMAAVCIWAGAVAVVGLASAAPADVLEPVKQPTIEYEIDFSETQNHYLNVTARFETPQPKTELMMATWAPGSYLIREYARHVDSMTITDQAGKTLEFEKTQKNRWMIKTKGVKSVILKYRLYCNEMTVRTNWTGTAYAMINGAPTFITPVNARQQRHTVKLNLPKRWKRSACALDNSDSPHTYIANSYDELVDNPIVAGNVQVYPFDVDGVPHQLVNVGESGYWDGVQAAADLKKMVVAHHEIWGIVPYKKYLFINMIAEAGGGLEHDNCTLIMTSRWSFRDSKKYQDWLSLASHEFFHTWNVRRLRPKNLVRYDYENEMYTRSLWIAEGITSYYEDLALVRSGLFTRKEYLQRLSETVVKVQGKPGRKVQDLSDCSFDTWIKFYRPDENSNNTRISYYSKGTVAAFLLDAKIRSVSKGKRSLDDVMRKMYSEYAATGYTPEDFRTTASEVAGVNLSEWFADSIDSTKELDFGFVGVLGVEVADLAKDKQASGQKKPIPKKNKKNKKNKAKNKLNPEGTPKASNKRQDKTKQPNAAEKLADENDRKPADEAAKADIKPWVGIGGKPSGSSMVVSSVAPDSPAYAAGIQTDDELLAINDFRLKGKISDRLKQFEVGETLEFLLSRRGQLLRIDVTPTVETKFDWKLQFLKAPNKRQKRSLDSWLGK